MTKLLKFEENDLYRLETLYDSVSGLLGPKSKQVDTISVLRTFFTTYGDRIEVLLPFISGPDDEFSLSNVRDKLAKHLAMAGYPEASSRADVDITAQLDPSIFGEAMTLEGQSLSELTELDLAFEQGDRLSSMDIERTIGDVTIKTSFYFDPPKVENHPVDINLSGTTSKEVAERVRKIMDEQLGAQRRAFYAGGPVRVDMSGVRMGERLGKTVPRSSEEETLRKWEEMNGTTHNSRRDSKTTPLTLAGVREELSERIQNNYSSLVNDTDNVIKDVRELSKADYRHNESINSLDRNLAELRDRVDTLHQQVRDLRLMFPEHVRKAHEAYLRTPRG